MQFNPITIALTVALACAGFVSSAAGYTPPAIVQFALAVIVLSSLKMANEWERAIILRRGVFTGIRGPGLFLTIPILDSVTEVIDTRIRTTEFDASNTMTKDTVPVNVDAVIFWMVMDLKRAALEVEDYADAVNLVSQTSLREIIGASDLATLLSNRKAIDERLEQNIRLKTAEWGITVRSVEVRDVSIPKELQEAMSRQAQAERERQARIILGTAEEEIARKFVNAAELYAGNPEAMQLRGMNMLYESMKERGSIVVIPSDAVGSMNMGGMGSVMGMLNVANALNPDTATPRAATPPKAA